MEDKIFKYTPGKSLVFKPWHAIDVAEPSAKRQPSADLLEPSHEPKSADSFPDFPSYADMLSNLGGSVIRNLKGALRGDKLRLTKNEKDKRLAICKGCEHYHTPQDRCKLCGCKVAVKAHLKLESCPVGKW
jgi:hypothetical protein